MTPDKTQRQTVARLLTNALNPFFVFTALYAAVALSEAVLPSAVGYIALEMLAAGSVAGYVRYMQSRRRVSGFWIPARAQRLVPAIFLLLISAALVAALALTNAPENLFRATLSMVLATITIAALTLLWKASAHTTVAGHAAVAGSLILGLPGLIFTSILPLVVWARVSPESHTLPQVLVGAGVGATFAFVFLA